MIHTDTQAQREIAANDDANVDPLSGEVGAHPIGVGLGAAAGGMAAGAAVGLVAGPLGMAVGAAIGAVAGGLVGKGTAEAIDPTAVGSYWNDNFASRGYVRADRTFDDYAPAYHYGHDRFGINSGLAFDDVEADLADGWTHARGTSRLDWDDARPAVRDSWDRARDLVTLR